MELRENLLICFGSPMIDAIARVDADILKKYDLRSNDATPCNNEEIFEDIKQYNPSYRTGGSITNTVKIAQSLLNTRKAVCYIGAIGNDKYGELLKGELLQANINFLYQINQDHPTGKCAVLLNKSNRSLVTDLGASKFLTIKFVNSIKNVLKEGKFFYMSAFFFGVSTEICEAICKYTHDRNKLFIFNIGAPFLCKKYEHFFKRTLSYVNVLIGNENEVLALADIYGIQETDLKKVASSLNLIRCTETKKDVIMIVTRTSEPVILVHRNKLIEFSVPKLQKIEILNTNGAGDAFVAGFSASLINGNSVHRSVESGINICYNYIKSNSFF